MKLLLVVPAYPYPRFPSSGIFSQRSAVALGEVCEHVEVLSPRPYAPPGLARLRPRWKSYAQIPLFQRDGRIAVHRPAYFQIPGAASLWTERATYLAARGLAAARHRDVGFDAILSFDLRGAAPLAWRLARRLSLPAAGWATGGDVRVDQESPAGRSVARSLRNLDLVFYQSRELRGIAARHLGLEERDLDPRRHQVLARGILEPPAFERQESRSRIRAMLGLAEEETAVLNIGRIGEAKGIYDLLAAASRVADSPGRIRFVLVGASPGFDESEQVSQVIHAGPEAAVPRAAAPRLLAGRGLGLSGRR